MFRPFYYQLKLPAIDTATRVSLFQIFLKSNPALTGNHAQVPKRITIGYSISKIRCWAIRNSSSLASVFGFVKLRSSALLIGTRCMCAWGTSKPITAMPHLLQANAFSIAFAIGRAKTSHSLRVSAGASKILSTSTLGTTNTCPSLIGSMSKNARKRSFSAIL